MNAGYSMTMQIRKSCCLAHVLMGSVAESIVSTTPCPVLTVRPEKLRFVMP